MTRLRLRPLRAADEPAFVAGHEALAREGFTFALGYQPGDPWSAYVRKMDAYRRGVDVPPHLVPGSFLAADVDGAVVGRASIRHRLNDFLAREGGHIGYGVLPDHRRRGYATEILRQSLVIARSVGVGRVLISCDDDNVGSATVIERCGGVFDSFVTGRDTGRPMRRYWID